jgi:hypothetical protein
VICLRLHIPFSSGVLSYTGKDQALLSVCKSSVSFYKLVRISSILSSWLTVWQQGREPLLEMARPLFWERARPFGKGLFQSVTLKT